MSGRFKLSPRRPFALAMLAGVALALRLATVFLLSGPVDERLTYEHGEIAENLLAGRGFTVHFLGAEGPTSQQAPLYPVMLAGCYALLGTGSNASLLLMQCLQCLAGVGIVLASFWLARNLVPSTPSVAWTTAVVAAVYPPHLYMVTHIQVVAWAALLLVTLLALVTSPRFAGTFRGAIVGGVLAGLVLLVDPILALALPVAALAFWRFGLKQQAIEDIPLDESHRYFDAWRTPFGNAVLMGAVALVVVAPWLVRNRNVHGEWVFIKSSFGYAFWQGNNPHSWGTDKIPKAEANEMLHDHDGSIAGWHQALWKARHETLYIDDVLLTPEDYRVMSAMTEPARSHYLGDRAWKFIAEEPAHYAKLCGQRLVYFLGIDPTNPKTAHPLYRGCTAVWLVLVTMGLLLARPHLRTLWPSLATFAVLAAFHALTITSVRFRIPLEPLSFVWAGLAVGPLLARLTEAWLDARQVETSYEPLRVVMPKRSKRRGSEQKKSAA